MKQNFPQLTEMGVLHPEQIERFNVNSVDHIDVLQVFYSRPKGSPLPISRIYKFPRLQRAAVISKDTGTTQEVMESAPALRAAIDELQSLLKVKEHKQTAAESILEELRLLEQDMAMRSARIRELTELTKAL